MSNASRVVLTFLLVVLTAAALFAGGFVVGQVTAGGDLLSQLVPELGPQLAGPGTVDPAQGGTPEDLQATFAPFWEAWDIVHEEYVDQPVNDAELMRGALRGMMEALDDPHSGYMDPVAFQIFNSDLSGNLEGIGAMVEQAGEYARIVSPLPGSPAEAAGIRPGDLIVEVDGVDVVGMDYLQVVSRVRGPAGTTVHLTIQREGEDKLLEFAITRASINIPSVEGKMLEGNVAYVKINDFGSRTTGELDDTLKSLLAQKPAGLVLDLRGNPGGFLNTAIDVVSQFIPEGVVMRERFGDGREVTYDARRGGRATQIPMVVLIDEGSASASEIVAGAIQDLGRGTVVGVTSYGKGSVQLPYELRGDNGGIRVTIARWLTPDGRSIHEQGIAPDVVVKLTEEDREAGRDPQLDRAVDLLTGGA